MIENLPVRLGVPYTNSEPNYYARMTTRAWAIPMADPLSNNEPQNVAFFGDVGVFGATGFEPKFSNQEIGFILGMCTGCFYRTEIVRVIRWPFSNQPPGHTIKWLAMGVGTIAVWAELAGAGWTIQEGETVGGGPALPTHTIVEPNEVGAVELDQFPGAFEPLAFSPVTLTNKPAQFKWCGAEGKFYPIVQAPSGTGIPTS
jgi:hypothetical protein